MLYLAPGSMMIFIGELTRRVLKVKFESENWNQPKTKYLGFVEQK